MWIKSLERDMVSAYLYGYDRIEFSSKRMIAEQKQVIRKVCYKPIGPEIIEESSDCVVIQDLLKSNVLSIKRGIHWTFLIVRSMQKDALKALKRVTLTLLWMSVRETTRLTGYNS